jgi:hypothetical protein
VPAQLGQGADVGASADRQAGEAVPQAVEIKVGQRFASLRITWNSRVTYAGSSGRPFPW